MERRIGEAVIVASPHNLPGSRRQLALGGGRDGWYRIPAARRHEVRALSAAHRP